MWFLLILSVPPHLKMFGEISNSLLWFTFFCVHIGFVAFILHVNRKMTSPPSQQSIRTKQQKQTRVFKLNQLNIYEPYIVYHTGEVITNTDRFRDCFSYTWYAIRIAAAIGRGNLNEIKVDIKHFHDETKLYEPIEPNANYPNTHRILGYLFPIPYVKWSEEDFTKELEAHFIQKDDAKKFIEYIFNVFLVTQNFKSVNDEYLGHLIRDICQVCVQLRKSEMIPHTIRKLAQNPTNSNTKIGTGVHNWMNITQHP